MIAHAMTRIELDAPLGWWRVQVWDDCWVDAGKALGLAEDTFSRSDATKRLAHRIERSLGLFVALTMLGGEA